MTSLTQQRIAIERSRTFALFGMSLGVICLAIATFVAIEDFGSLGSWALLAGSAVVIGVNLAAYLRARGQLHAFEAGHGHGAGSQSE